MSWAPFLPYIVFICHQSHCWFVLLGRRSGEGETKFHVTSQRLGIRDRSLGTSWRESKIQVQTSTVDPHSLQIPYLQIDLLTKMYL